MADPLTHSHDTATPALSVESEYVLVPREPTEAMLNATPASYSSSFKTIWPLVCGDIYRIMIAAAPALNPSPAAKGGEAVQDVRLDSEKAEEWPAAQKALWRVVTGENLNDGHYINAYRLTEKLYAAITALAAPSPQPAHSDDLAVDRFAVAMKAKLADARAKGKGGWYDETACSQKYLSDELRRHALKPDPLDVANFAMFLHQRNEEIALPSPQPANAVREALEAARDYISDAATGTLTYKGSGEGFKAMAAEDLACLDAALAALASDPAPSSPDLEALRAENEAYRNAARDMLNNWRFGNFYAPQQPEPLYVRKFAQLHKAGSDRIASQVIARSQAASDPAPAGEAVEPVAWGAWNGEFYETGPDEATMRYRHEPTRKVVPLYAHPAPEDTARLREDLERVTRERDTFADICLVVSGHLELPHSESGPCDDSRRYDRELTSLEALYRRTEDERVEHMEKRFKAEAEAETFKRERDDARKALETAEGEIDRLVSALHEIENLWLAPGHDSLKVMRAKDIARAARFASREGASDE